MNIPAPVNSGCKTRQLFPELHMGGKHSPKSSWNNQSRLYKNTEYNTSIFIKQATQLLKTQVSADNSNSPQQRFIISSFRVF